MRDRLKNGLNAFNSILKLMICLEMVINLFELKFFFNIEVFFTLKWVHKNQKTLSHFQITFSTSLLFNNNRCRTTKSVRLICLIDKLSLKMVHGTPRGGLWGGGKGVTSIHVENRGDVPPGKIRRARRESRHLLALYFYF